MPAQAKSKHVDIVCINVIFCLLFLTLHWIENTDTLSSKYHNNVSYSDMQICGRRGLHSTESGEGHTASKKKTVGSRGKFWARYFINSFLIKWNKSIHYLFLNYESWENQKEKWSIERKHFCFSYHLANSMRDITPLFFWQQPCHILWSYMKWMFPDVFKMVVSQRRTLSVREEHCFKTITFFKMNIISKSCHGPHSEPQRAAFSLWTICCAGLQ